MMTRKRWTGVMVLLALLLIVLGCEANSPTAPPNDNGPNTPPPTSANVTVSVSNANPIVNSTSTISASVTDANGPAPNGTAVEFSTDLGVFVDTALATTIRTTENGVATAILTASQVGTAEITVRVNNVVKKTSVTFKETPTQPGEPVPTISSFDPSVGKPAGGQLVTIRGANFDPPVRVLFGDKEAPIASATTTEIRAVTPAINLTLDEQFKEVQLQVITEAGTQGEQSATATNAFRYELEILTPKVLDVSPSSGPNEGNTRITILGEGFQSPAKVYFGTGGGGGGALSDQVEATVLQVTFNQIIAMTPPALGLGAELANSQVTIRVQNVASGTDTVLANAFRYGPSMAITSVGPTQGPATGGTRVTINGWGFDDPVAVIVGGIAAQVVRVSGTEIVVVTGAPRISGCGDVSGPISVTNVENGNSADGPNFTYILDKPAITLVTPTTPSPGGTVNVYVANPGSGNVRFKIGDSTRLPSNSVDAGGGVVRYTITVPSTVEFAEEPCGSASEGMRFVAAPMDVSFENTTTTCTDTLPDAIEVQPSDRTCRIPPVASASAASITFADTTNPATDSSALSISNTGGGTLQISSATSSSPVFSVTSGTFPSNLSSGQQANYTITFAPPAGAASYTGTITFTTNAGNVVVNVSGNGL